MTTLSKQTSRVRRAVMICVLAAVPLTPLVGCGDGGEGGGETENEQNQDDEDDDEDGGGLY